MSSSVPPQRASSLSFANASWRRGLASRQNAAPAEPLVKEALHFPALQACRPGISEAAREITVLISCIGCFTVGGSRDRRSVPRGRVALGRVSVVRCPAHHQRQDVRVEGFAIAPFVIVEVAPAGRHARRFAVAVDCPCLSRELR